MNRVIKKKLAIFDIDGTVFRSSLLVELINTLTRRRLFPKTAKEEMERDYLLWTNRQGSYENYIKKVNEVHRKYLCGCKKTDIDKVIKEVIKWQRDRVYVFTRELIKTIKPEFYLLAISGSPQDIVQKFADYFGFDRVYGRILEMKDGKTYTGRVLNEDFISNKKEVLRGFLRETGFSLKNSLGVGDTESDVSFLEMVSRPIVFNPNRGLAKIARKRKWLIAVERKDVIYYL
ncbi:MAG: HAD-IB family phosphatase [bacterium]|nr:HAD-IB family phosphatase [bacterium]